MTTNYEDLLKDILLNGEDKDDRTGVGTISVFGRQLRFDLRNSFPATTTKKLAWKSCFAELLWFIEGSGDERRLAEITYKKPEGKTTIWTANADAEYWKKKAKFQGDLGRVYGVQWRHWKKYDEKLEFGKPQSIQRVAADRTEIDQLKNLIDGLMNDPNGRRHILTAWNIAEFDQMALPPCHVMSQYYVNKNKELSCHMYQRSVDAFLGLPFNIASYALLTNLIAHHCGFTPGELVISTGDTHIYKNHIDQVNEQLTRDPYDFPKLIINQEKTNIFDITLNDIKLINYQSHGTIKADMAV